MTEQREKLYAFLILLIGVIPVAYGFRTEFFFPEVQFSDTAFHLGILNALDQSVRHGGSLFDFWFEASPFGFALFRSYQYLPYEFIYLLYRVTGGFFSLAQVLISTTAFLAVVFPVSCYFGLRLLSIPRLEAAFAAVTATLISDGGEYGLGLQNYTFGTTGIITQLWAMVFLPLGIGFFYRYFSTGRSLGCALLFSVLTFGSHVVAAFVLFFACSTLCFADGITFFLQRIKALFLYGVLLFCAIAHQWWFVLQDSKYINKSALEPSWKYQGRGIGYLSSSLWEGTLFDNTRFPILTLLLIVGFLLAIIRPTDGSPKRRFASLFVLFFTLCAGRTIWGFFLNSIPVLANLHVHRFAVGVHFAGSILIGYALAFGFRYFTVSNARMILGLFLSILVLRPAYLERASMYDIAWNRHNFAAAQFYGDTDLQSILTALKAQPYGWVYTGSSQSWQEELKVAGFIPLDIFTTEAGIPTVGGVLYHAFSLAGETLFDFSPKNESHFDLYGITSIISPADWIAPSSFHKVLSAGKYSLWSRSASRVFIGDAQFLHSENFSGQTDLMRTWVSKYHILPTNLPLELKPEVAHVNAEELSATLDLKRDELVILTHGYHPNWQVRIDESQVKTEWVSPGFIGVNVPAGKHHLQALYVPSKLKPFLVLLSILVIIVSFFIQKIAFFNKKNA